MKLIYLYGPPATGKLTVAKELSKLTGYKVMHNHLFNDLVETIMDYDNPDFFKLTEEFRRQLIKAAVENKTKGAIVTMCYTYPNENEKCKKRFQEYDELGIETKFIHLYADKEELIKRVGGESRLKHGKLKDSEKLCNLLDELDFYTKIPFVESLEIDNTNLTPAEVARQINKYVNK
jgi:shikimate kinase